jgi:hypothetical protein
VTGVVWVGFSVRVFVCTGSCAVEPAVGGLLTLLISIGVVVMISFARSVAARPVDPEGSSAWLYGLSIIFALGVAAAVTRIPSVSCPPGSHLSFFGFCAGAHSARLAVHSREWIKALIDAAGIVVAFTLVRSKRWVHAGAPIAGAVWLAGTSDFLVRTMGRG